ncbi:MAG: hypothetical protein PVG65_02855 [Candidatus Thorarchaeota archaeon]|jgi:hypothetical protein
MRKAVSKLLIIGLLIGGILQSAQAQAKTLEFNINAGFRTERFFEDTFFTLGAGLDFHPLEYFMISSELQFWGYSSIFDVFMLSPSATLNLKWKSFFLGGGVMLPIDLSGGTVESGVLIPKFNAGLRISKIKLMLYLITKFEDYHLLGASIGIVF